MITRAYPRLRDRSFRRSFQRRIAAFAPVAFRQPGFFEIAQHAPGIDPPPAIAAEHPRLFQLGQTLADLFRQAPGQCRQGPLVHRLTVDFQIATRLVHDRQHFDPQSPCRQRTELEPRISAPVRRKKLEPGQLARRQIVARSPAHAAFPPSRSRLTRVGCGKIVGGRAVFFPDRSAL